MNWISIGALSRSLFGHLITHLRRSLSGLAIALPIQSLDPSLSAQLILLQTGNMDANTRCAKKMEKRRSRFIALDPRNQGTKQLPLILPKLLPITNPNSKISDNRDCRLRSFHLFNIQVC